MQSINPYTGEIIATYQVHSRLETLAIIDKVQQAWKIWKKRPTEERAALIAKLGELMEQKKHALASLITNEMGKPIRESIAEIEKCIGLCRYHSLKENAGAASSSINTEAAESYVSFEPMGIVFAIMPWNFPFWQVMRFAIPNLAAGNAALLKHAPNVTGCALAIEKLFLEAGFTENTFRVLVIPHEEAETVIAHPHTIGVTLTGSGRAGSAVAALAGKHLKKSVLELGGSDPFIVFADADLGNTCLMGVKSRMINTGQVCISAKRFLVENAVFDEFISETLSLMQALKAGDPMLPDTDIGPMARPDLVEQIAKQVNTSIAMGAKLLAGGSPVPANPMIFQPTLLTNVKAGMPVLDEETFGPVSVVIPFETVDEAITLANNTPFGLAASVWTNDIDKAKYVGQRLACGGVFVNSMTKSDPRLPFGGIKASGYGRELSAFGIREFLNIKTYWID